ncbi:hypothetical protein L7F22_035446 [Adiantum nelumboides]|nr:hypothetical protein [Adiantum nelumboides]
MIPPSHDVQVHRMPKENAGEKQEPIAGLQKPVVCLQKLMDIYVASSASFHAISLFKLVIFAIVAMTLCKDNDPMDVLIIMQEPVLPGCVLRASHRSHAMIDQGEKDDKIAICEDDLDFQQCNDIKDLPPHRLAKIKHFFEDYKKNQIGCNLEQIDEEDIIVGNIGRFVPPGCEVLQALNTEKCEHVEDNLDWSALLPREASWEAMTTASRHAEMKIWEHTEVEMSLVTGRVKESNFMRMHATMLIFKACEECGLDAEDLLLGGHDV